jgi:hypothetical protein
LDISDTVQREKSEHTSFRINKLFQTGVSGERRRNTTESTALAVGRDKGALVDNG